MDEAIEQIRHQFLGELKGAVDTAALENLKVKFLGKKGAVQGLMAQLKSCAPEERPQVGAKINGLKEQIGDELAQAHEVLEAQELNALLESEALDVTLPGRCRFRGHRHVVLAILDRALEIFKEMGFSVQLGPDVENDFYNFEALNFGKDHPARDMQDTFYFSPELLLRTHTSNTQVRIMESQTPPIRVVCPGKCFRNEDISARSHVVFHQIEGFYINTDVTFADLLSTLEIFFQRMFHKELKFRYRPSYFPFVEPGMEMDISCLSCQGAGCTLCKKSGWLEVLGAGMIHPEVLKSGGIDPEAYSGYAWGLGIERLALLRHHIPDIRLFLENRLSFLRQF